jgi:hypothetical protein
MATIRGRAIAVALWLAGDVRTLVVERAGKSITIEAKVERLL